MAVDDMERLLKKTIPQIQQKLRDMDKTEQVTVEDMKNLLRIEKMLKNRRGITNWLTFGIMSGKLPGEYFLDYQAKVGLYKSAVQKYIRRSNIEKAVRAAKVFYGLSKDQAIRRMKIIAVEDAFSAVEVLRCFHDGMSLKEFLQVVAVIAGSPKDKSLCPLGWELTEGSLAPRVAEATPSIEWLKANLLNKNEYQEVVIQLFKLVKDKRFSDIYEVFNYDQDAVVKQCLDRVAGGTFWESDTALLLMAAIRYKQGDYALKDLTLPHIEENGVQPLKLTEIDWFCIDFHTHIGRVAERFFLHEHKEIPQKTLQGVWFHAESAKLDGEIIADWVQPYDKQLWARIKDEIKQTVEDVMYKKFRFKEIDEQGALKWPHP